jgi:pimeloyl-ACP methyl ester carboxylesterase
VVIFEQSGHYPFVEEAEAFRHVVRGWLARAG